MVNIRVFSFSHHLWMRLTYYYPKSRMDIHLLKAVRVGQQAVCKYPPSSGSYGSDYGAVGQVTRNCHLKPVFYFFGVYICFYI
jgi:hypothetical protein